VTTALADGTNGVITTRTIQWSDSCSGSSTSGSGGDGGHSYGGDGGHGDD
jgi:hypothetical protein